MIQPDAALPTRDSLNPRLPSPHVSPDGDAVLVLGINGTIRSLNAIARQLMGLAEYAGLDQPVESLWPESSRTGLRHALAAAMVETSGRVEARFDGPPPSWWSCTATKLPGHQAELSLICRDITEEVATRTALARSDARLRALTEHPRSMSWFMQLDGTMTQPSRRWHDFTGIDLETCPPETWLQLIHPDDRDRVQRETRIALRGEDTHEMLFRARRVDGAWRWVRRRTMPVRDAAGRLIEWVGFAIDVTETRDTQTENRLLRQLVDAVPDLVHVADADGRLRYINPAGRALIALDPDTDVSALTIADPVAPGHQATMREEVVPAAREAGIWAGDLQLVNHRTGTLIDTHFTTLGLRNDDGHLEGFGTVAVNVTEARRARAALAESEARFRNLVEAMPQMAFVAGPDGQLAFQNPRWVEYTGIPRDAASGECWLDFLHVEDMAATLAAWTQSLKTGEPFAMEHRLRRADGGYCWFLSRALPLRTSDGTVTQWLATATDISEIVAAREASARHEAELETLVAERTRALSEAAQELASEIRRREEMQSLLQQSRKLEALGQLTGGVAHDFNNILSAILGSFSSIRRRTHSQPLLDAVARGEQAAERAGNLVRQLLTFARKQELRPETLDVHPVIAEVDDLISHTLGSRIRRVMDIPDNVWPIWADAQHLENALLNLAINARDAMPDGGTLALTARNLLPGERPAHLPGRDYVAIGVLDTGQGMPPSVLARATEPFFTTKEQGKGTGLGLAMANSFAEQSGGFLSIRSTPNLGTTVEIILPRPEHEPVAPSEEGVTELDPALHGGAMVMVVEADDRVRLMIAGMLRSLRYMVVEARNAEVALVLMQTLDRLDLVVTDVSTSGADDFALAAHLRSQRPDLPILFISNQPPGPELEREAVLLGPFNQARLANAVLERLGRQSLVAHLRPPAGKPLLARVRTLALRDLYFAWSGACVGDALPQASDIHPDAFGLRQHSYLVSVGPSDDTAELRYAWAGDAIVTRLGRPLVGEKVNSAPADEEVLGSLEAAYRRCERDRQPVYQFMRFDFGDGSPTQFERLLLPLAETGREISQLLGVVLFPDPGR